MYHGVYCPKICIANLNIDKSSCPKDCLPIPTTIPYGFPNTAVSQSMMNQNLTPNQLGMGMIAVNHGLPGGTLMQVGSNPFNSLVGGSTQVISAVNPNFNRGVSKVMKVIDGSTAINGMTGMTGMQGIPPFSSNFVDPNLMSD